MQHVRIGERARNFLFFQVNPPPLGRIHFRVTFSQLTEQTLPWTAQEVEREIQGFPWTRLHVLAELTVCSVRGFVNRGQFTLPFRKLRFT
jgi:hypothetical protein